MRDIKFRAWDGQEMFYFDLGEVPANFYSQKIMQFTGLLGKNGVEIYEGDIVEFATSKNHYRGSVEFGKGMYTVKRGLDFYLNEIVERGAEVIGNIHENPELLS